MEVLEQIKTLLGVDDEEEVINEIIKIITQKITNYIKEPKVPKNLEWILVELTIIRFNKRGSEGTVSENVDGASTTYVEDDFINFIPYLDNYLNQKGTSSSKGWWLL